MPPPRGECCRPHSAPRDTSRPLPGRRASVEVISRDCRQERQHFSTTPRGLSSCSPSAWQETYLDSWSTCILPSVLETGTVTSKRLRRKTNYMTQRPPDQCIIHAITSSLAWCKAEGKLPFHGCWSSCFLVQRRSGRRFGIEVQPSMANEALGWRSSWRMARSWTCSPGSPRRHWPDTQKDRSPHPTQQLRPRQVSVLCERGAGAYALLAVVAHNLRHSHLQACCWNESSSFQANAWKYWKAHPFLRKPEKEMATQSSVLAWRNPIDRGTWQATVPGVSKSQTRLSN